MPKILKEVINKVKEAKWYLVGITIFFVIVIIINKPFKNDYNYEFKYNHIIQGGRTPQIEAGVEVSQNFIAKGNNLNQIGMMIAMPSISTQSTVNVKLIEVESQIQILDQDVFLGSLKDGDYFVVNIENQFNSRGKEYKIILKGLDGDSTNSIQILKSTVSDEKLLNCYIGNEKDECGWVFLTRYYFNYLKYEVIGWITLYLVSVIFVCVLLDNNADEKSFLKICISLGIFIIIYTGFFHVFDESSHYFRTIMVSQGDFYDYKTENGEFGGFVPKNYDKYAGLYTYLHLKTVIFDPTVLVEQYSSEFEYNSNPYFASTIPTSHIVPAFGLFIGRILHLGIAECMYMARLSVFAFYTSVCYIAIKKMKYYKSTMVVVATTPISLWLAGTIHLDPIVTSVCLLFLSICLNYRWDKNNEELKISKRDLCSIVFCAIFIVTCKYLTLTPILLLFFLIPKEKFNSKKQYILFVVFAIILGLCMIIWQLYMLETYKYVEDRNGHTSMEEQLEYMKNNVIDTIILFMDKTISYSMFWNKNFSYDSAIPAIGSSIGIVILLSGILDKNKTIFENKKEYWINTIILIVEYFIMLFVALLAIYLTYNPVGNHNIDGYQIRYLVPILMLVLIPIGNLFKVENKINNYYKLLMFIMFVLNLDIIIGELIKTF